MIDRDAIYIVYIRLLGFTYEEVGKYLKIRRLDKIARTTLNTVEGRSSKLGRKFNHVDIALRNSSRPSEIMHMISTPFIS